MKNRGQRRAPVAASIVALASLVGPTSALAEECGPKCVPQPPAPPENGFLKAAEHGFPGSTANAFLKARGQNAFLKQRELGFPGSSENHFLKAAGG